MPQFSSSVVKVLKKRSLESGHLNELNFFAASMVSLYLNVLTTCSVEGQRNLYNLVSFKVDGISNYKKNKKR